MTLQEITAKMKEGAAKKSAFGNTVKFATDQGVVYIDGNANPPAVSNDDKAADCTLKMAFSDFDDMIERQARRHDRVHDRQAQDRRRHGRRHEAAKHCALGAQCGGRQRFMRGAHPSKDKQLTTRAVSGDTALFVVGS
jgi:hypothetical protein